MPRKAPLNAISRLAAAIWILACAASSALAVGRTECMEARASIRSADLQQHVNVLADDSMEGRQSGTRGIQAANGYLVERFQSAGLKPLGDNGRYTEEFDQAFKNVIGLVEGSDPQLRQEFVLIGAHYDHVGYGSPRRSFGPFGQIHNGADDNASGVSGVLEILDAIRVLPSPPRRSIILALWDGEELGLLGSKYFASHPPIPLEKIVLAINLDMIGRMRDERVEIFGTRTAAGLRRFISETEHDPRMALDFDWELKPNSDHYSFFEHRVPSLMLHTGLHDDMHRPSDDAERINSNGMEQIARLAFGLAYEAAMRPDTFAFRPYSQQESPSDQRQLERPLPPAEPRLGLRWTQDSTAEGLVVTEVDAGSAAERSGIQRGDRLVEFANQPVRDSELFRRAVLAAQSPVATVLRRSGSPDPIRLSLQLDGSPTRLGLSWREDSAEPSTLIVTRVIPGSPSAAADVRVGDRIYAVDEQPFRTPDEFMNLVTSLASPLRLTLERKGLLQIVSLEVPAPLTPQKL